MDQTITKNIVKKCDEVSQVLGSLSHPVRLKILCQVLEEPKSVNELTEFCEISQSAMSQFLGRMKDEGVLTSKREGHFVYYGLGDQRLLRLLKAIKDIYC